MYHDGPNDAPETWVKAMAVCADQVRAAQKGNSGNALDELQVFRSALAGVRADRA